ncbi:hypothetical protein BSZ05_22680 [Vibrio mediterranei]|uniref:Uncharacterized protein n=1 Tax=Vibrio mediterranei TaxID=689 RepID=A0AAN1KQG5_9VIBR|nr:hypothetical protein BSZ05_22680 [Vibrio mediterranei]
MTPENSKNTIFNLLALQTSMVLHSFIGLDLVGKTHAPKTCRVFVISDFGALLSYEVPSVKVLDISELRAITLRHQQVVGTIQ